MIKTILPKLVKRLIRYSGASVSSSPVIQDVPSKFHWDDCEPRTNGEYFLIESYAKEWKTVFDIGANEGYYAKKIWTINPRSRVYCFEPNPQLVGRIRANVPGQPIINAAAGDRVGTLEINFNRVDPTQSSPYRRNANTEAVAVPQITLDQYAKSQHIKKIDFVKIDTEGHELAVLRGARGLLAKRAISMIQFEYGGCYRDAGTTLRQIYQLLSPNYIICHLRPGGLMPCSYSAEVETYRYSNWVALSRDLYA